MTQLLVSVRSALEAVAAIEGGADLIDVKEPANGSLGRPDERTVAAVVEVVAERLPVSAALGEWIDSPGEIAVPGLAYVKWGLAGCADRTAWRSAIAQRLTQTATPRLVLAAYADWECAQAPPIAEIVNVAMRGSGRVLLIDTHCKIGANSRRPTLLDWMTVAEIERLCAEVHACGIRVALAGSLGIAEVSALLHVRPDWFAVRGAVCGAGDRSNSVEADKVRAIKSLISAG